MVWFTDVKPALEDQEVVRKLEQVKQEDIFRNLSEEDFEKAQNWFQSLRREEQLNLNGALTILANVNIDRKTHGLLSHDFAVIVAGSSISSSDYSDIDLFLLPRQLSEKAVGITTGIKSPFDSNDFTYRIRPALAPFNCFYGDEECGYGDNRPAAFEEANFGKEITAYILQEVDGEHDFRRRREEFGDDFLFVPAHAEGMIRHNREQGSKFLVLSRGYQPIEREGVSLYECFGRESCVLYQHGALKPKVQKYMCDGLGRETSDKNIAKDKPACPIGR
jgi:hypothetical protein